MKTHTLKIMHDTNSENPWTEWDCEPPLFTQGGRDFGNTAYNFENKNPIIDLIDLIPKGKVNKNVLELFNLDKEENYPIRRSDYNNQYDFIIDSLYELETTIKNIEALCIYAKIPHLSWTSRGYSQGDWIECILVITPEYIKSVGTSPEHFNSILQGSKNLFDAWAWGDVYGYELIELIPLTRPDGTLSTETEENIIDSCWGFYGDDGLEQIKSELPPEHQHLFDDARNNIQ